MLTKLRIKLARMLFKFSMGLTPAPENTEAYKSLPEELKLPQDAVAEIDEEIATWEPQQHGNVVIAEPELMSLYRRNKL